MSALAPDMERFVADLSATLTDLSIDNLDAVIDRVLRQLTEYADTSRAYLFLRSEDGDALSCTHEYRRASLPSHLAHLQGLNVGAPSAPHGSSPIDIAPRQVSDAVPIPADTRILAMHLVHEDVVVGAVGLDEPCHDTGLASSALVALGLVAQVLALALAHRRTRHAVREAYRDLDERARVRSREMTDLFGIARRATSRDELEPTLTAILADLRQVLDLDAALILLTDGEMLSPCGYTGSVRRDALDSLRVPANALNPSQRATSYAISDLRQDTPSSRALRISDLATLFPGNLSSGSFLAVPLRVANQVLGCLCIMHHAPNQYDLPDRELATVFAHQIAMIAENAHLHVTARERLGESERRRRVAESLGDLLAALNSNRTLDEMLAYIAEQISVLLEPSAVAIYRIIEERGTIKMQASRGLPPEFVARAEVPLGQGALGLAITQNRTITIPDARALRKERDMIRAANSEAYARVEDWKPYAAILNRVGALLAMPLVVADRPYGGVILHYPQAREFSQDEITLAETLVQHAALAIENARLREQAEQVAVLSERSRLARELHDSVSQALYGIGLGVRTARTMVDRESLTDETRARLSKPLDYALSLAEAGLAEMRALIFGLRPDALEKEGLVAAMERQAAALQARHQLTVHTEMGAEPNLSLEAKEALYRVAQEALNNVIKHAHARHIEVRLVQDEDGDPWTRLEIRDDGHGFDPSGDYPGHLGLHTMRERITKLGGSLDIASAPGQGTVVRAKVPGRTNQKS